MQERINKMNNHFVVCGIGRVGTNVAHELAVTEREFVVIDEAAEAIALFHERHPQVPALHGDSSDDEFLELAGIRRAAGVFAITGDDSKNLMVTLAAKQLAPNARVVARCHEVRNIEKLKRVGADAIVSPDFTGGMRIASSMLRPAVVSFLDEMLRTDDKLRVEEVDHPRPHHARGDAHAAGEVRRHDRVRADAFQLVYVAHLMAARHDAQGRIQLLGRERDEQVLAVIAGDRE